MQGSICVCRLVHVGVCMCVRERKRGGRIHFTRTLDNMTEAYGFITMKMYVYSTGTNI